MILPGPTANVLVIDDKNGQTLLTIHPVNHRSGLGLAQPRLEGRDRNEWVYWSKPLMDYPLDASRDPVAELNEAFAIYSTVRIQVNDSTANGAELEVEIPGKPAPGP